MSEEIASADSLLIINADLSRQIGEQNTTIGYQDAMLARFEVEHDLTKALLIKMRRYFVSHGLLTGECVAWMQIKVRYGIGESQEVDAEWLNANAARLNLDALPLVTAQRPPPPATSHET